MFSTETCDCEKYGHHHCSGVGLQCHSHPDPTYYVVTCVRQEPSRPADKRLALKRPFFMPPSLMTLKKCLPARSSCQWVQRSPTPTSECPLLPDLSPLTKNPPGSSSHLRSRPPCFICVCAPVKVVMTGIKDEIQRLYCSYQRQGVV